MKVRERVPLSKSSGLEELVFPDPEQCFGCSPHNRAGMGLRFFREGRRVLCPYVFDQRFQGAPGIVHGGLQAVVLDEAMCAAVFFNRGSYVLTAELNIRFCKPCPTGVLVRVRSEIVAEEDRFAVVHAKLTNEAEVLLTSASGRFYYDRSREGGEV